MNELTLIWTLSLAVPFGLTLAVWYGLRRFIGERLTRALVLAWHRTRIWLFHRGFSWLRPVAAWLVSWLYLILPVDLVPDVILGVGWLDDALLTLLMQIWWIRDWLACDPEEADRMEQKPWFPVLFHGLAMLTAATAAGVTALVVWIVMRFT